MPAQRRLVRFTGNVQGVGFRYTAIRLAGSFDVSGYVKNLPNGSVEVVVEGPAEQIDSFLGTLRDRMGYYIHETTEQVAQPLGEFSGFDVRF